MKSNITLIRPRHGWLALELEELWEFRHLITVLAWRDISSRYRQTLMGIGWAILQPVVMMLVFTVIFGMLGKLPCDGKPYPVFAYIGMLPWQYFSQAASQSALSLWGSNAPLLSKVYFPRLILPLAGVLVPLLDFVIALVVLIFLMMFYGLQVSPTVLLLPLYFLLAVCSALGIGMWWAALGAEYRDIRHALPLIFQVWLYLSPVAYSTSMIPAQWRTLYAINPMVSVIEGFRFCLLGSGVLTSQMLLVSSVSALACLLGGAFAFRQVEKTLTDTL